MCLFPQNYLVVFHFLCSRTVTFWIPSGQTKTEPLTGVVRSSAYYTYIYIPSLRAAFKKHCIAEAEETVFLLYRNIISIESLFPA